MKKLFETNSKLKWVVIGLLLIIIGAVMFIIIMSNNSKENTGNTDNSVSEKENTTKKYTYLVISINPKIMLKINDEVITEVYQLNEDAIIFTNDKLKGLNLEDGIQRIIDIASSNNYINDDTEINLSVYEVKSDDGEINKYVTSLVEKKFIENGISVKRTYLTVEEQEEIISIIEHYEEKTKELEDEKKDDLEDKSEEDDKEHSTEKTTSTTTTTKVTSSTTTTTIVTTKTSNTKTSEEVSTTTKPVVTTTTTSTTTTKAAPTKLDVSKAMGDYSATIYTKLRWNNPNFSSPRAYIDEVIRRCNNNTLLEMYPDMIEDESYKYIFSGSDAVAKSCEFIKNKSNYVVYDNYYKGKAGFEITEEGVYPYSPIGFCISISLEVEGGCGSGPYYLPYTLTSDTEKYYLEVYDEDNTIYMKCTSGKNLVFTCDNSVATDEYTGKEIYTYSHS